jgi:hypothetical protein
LVPLKFSITNDFNKTGPMSSYPIFTPLKDTALTFDKSSPAMKSENLTFSLLLTTSEQSINTLSSLSTVLFTPGILFIGGSNPKPSKISDSLRLEEWLNYDIVWINPSRVMNLSGP